MIFEYHNSTYKLNELENCNIYQVYEKYKIVAIILKHLGMNYLWRDSNVFLTMLKVLTNEKMKSLIIFEVKL